MVDSIETGEGYEDIKRLSQNQDLCERYTVDLLSADDQVIIQETELIY